MNQERLKKFYSLILESNECWIWQGNRSRTKCTVKEYGMFHQGGKNRKAHRVSYEHFNASLTEGLTIHHICNNGLCVNPKHLQEMTLRENVLLGNGMGAINARKTHCSKGHEFSEDNTNYSGNHRSCRICNKIRSKEWTKAQRVIKQ